MLATLAGAACPAAGCGPRPDQRAARVAGSLGAQSGAGPTPPPAAAHLQPEHRTAVHAGEQGLRD